MSQQDQMFSQTAQLTANKTPESDKVTGKEGLWDIRSEIDTILSEFYEEALERNERGALPRYDWSKRYINYILKQVIEWIDTEIIGEDNKIDPNTNTANKIHFQAKNELRKAQQYKLSQLKGELS